MQSEQDVTQMLKEMSAGDGSIPVRRFRLLASLKPHKIGQRYLIIDRYAHRCVTKES